FSQSPWTTWARLFARALPSGFGRASRAAPSTLLRSAINRRGIADSAAIRGELCKGAELTASFARPCRMNAAGATVVGGRLAKQTAPNVGGQRHLLLLATHACCNSYTMS